MIPEEKKFYTIGEASRLCGVPEYSIRYWEKEFHLLRPVRRESGHRRFVQKDMDTLLEIKDLIYRRKMTLEGAKKHLSKKRSPELSAGPDAETARLLREIHKELSALLKE